MTRWYAAWNELWIDLPWGRMLLGLLVGLLYCLGLAPWDYWIISLGSVWGFSRLLQKTTPQHAFWLGWAYGIGLWASGVSWLWVSIHEFGDTSSWLAALMVLLVAVVMGFMTAVQGLIYVAARINRSPVWGFAALWVLFEWLRSWVLTGFPWLYLGYGFIDTPLAGYAPIGGVFLVSAMACLGVLLLAAMKGRSAMLAAMIIVLGWGLQHHAYTHALGKPLTVSIIQGNIPQDTKWDESSQDSIIATYKKLSRQEWGRDIVLWPEAAITKFYDEATDDLIDLDSLASTHGSTLITGIPYVAPGGPPYYYYNAVIALGQGRGIYKKQRLVPFGEYVPFASVLRGLMPFFDLPMSGFSWGRLDQPPLQAGWIRVQPSICYEVAYPELLQYQARSAELLVTISNDAWFGGSHGPWQHFEMVRMRSLETGRYFLSGTNNGISAIVNPQGKVVSEAPQFRQAVLRGQVSAMVGLTPWLVVGNTLVIGLSLSILGVVAGIGVLQGKRDRVVDEKIHDF
ncbi:MAG: apolipoprotein N-acyltransferase [Pseudomonadales bacterium]|nr:apolipoprotein N-acyltransferase [Pseudomonadales bacterium]